MNTNTFSSDEQLKKVDDFFNTVEKPSCNCSRGVIMCMHTPCLGTVEDMEKLLDAGYAKFMSLNSWAGKNTKEDSFNKVTGKKTMPTRDDNKYKYEYFNNEDIYYLMPSIIGTEGKKAQFNNFGTCTFLKDSKCSLHDKNLKPIQGRMACCKVQRVFNESNGKQVEIDERILIMYSWNTQKGKDLIERWKKEVEFTGDDKIQMPDSLEELMMAFTNVLSSHAAMAKNMTDLGINKDEDITKTFVTYEKPYLVNN